MMPSTSTISDENLRHPRYDGLKSLLHDSPTNSGLVQRRPRGVQRRPRGIQYFKYDVFISFRGPDTRYRFVDHLYSHLTRKGIFVFKDDTRLEQGESLSPQLLGAINSSRVAIVVFSKNYATSTWCLNEMAAITRCLGDQKQTVLPVFYDVNPSDVRKQIGVYEEAFLSHTSKRDSYEVDQWRTTMTTLAGLVGWDVRNKSESDQIEKIAQVVIEKLGHAFSGSIDDLIGIQPRLEALESLLKLSSEDGSPFLGIWGMAGIGKRTLATALYDRISYQFNACCFIESVSRIYEDGGITAVEKQILSQAIKVTNLDTYSSFEISGMVRNRLHNIKLLVVLDDVDQIEQLEELHISPELLHAGSRIIITTRDEHILKQYRVKPIYETQLMNDDDAYQLLCRKAFKSDNSSSTFAELIPEVLKYAQGLPIAIKLMGSFLYGRSVTEWGDNLKRLKNKPPDKGIMKVLRISFEGLEQTERDIFLHVACFFNGEMEDYVRRILDACGLNPAIGIQLLVEKSLITIRNKEIHMHGMLKELGKQIVRGEHLDKPKFWSRLWVHEDFHRVMKMTEKAAIEAKAIVLDQKEEDVFKFDELRAENLSKLENLNLLILHHKKFLGTSAFLSNSLRYLLWNGYPFDCLPSDFQPYYLVELNMPNSSMEQLWSGIKKLPNLKRMDLSNSKNLMVTPSFYEMQSLERLDLAGCVKLRHVHRSIRLLRKLSYLSLQNCSSLVTLDFGDDRSQLSSLRVMCLSGCAKLKKTPTFKGALNLEYLDMDQCTSLSAIHESIGGRANLKFLSLRDCTNLVTIPLVSSYSSLPLQCLVILDLSFSNISELPDAVGELRCLERLNLQGNKIRSVPSTIKKLSSLAYLNLSHCHRLEKAPELPTESSPSVGKYFETTSGSRNHRSGLYIFDCPKTKTDVDMTFTYFALNWLLRLLKEPRHFRCGFDIVHPWEWKILPHHFSQLFSGGSVITIKDPPMNDDWIGFVFCVEFEVNNNNNNNNNNNHPPISGSSQLPYPFYLSFEREHTEERFDMPLSLERHMVDGKSYLWTIYISREHCHFVDTEAHITFKAQQGLIVNQWGLGMLSKKDSYSNAYLPLLAIDYIEESNSDNSSSNSFESKIQLPYNWLVSDEDKIQNDEAKRKETDLSNQGLFTA